MRTPSRFLARGARRLAVCALVGSAFLCAAVGSRADDEPERDTSKTPRAGAPHLRFQKTYGAALFEARVRNLPVLVSRHKDF